MRRGGDLPNFWQGALAHWESVALAVFTRRLRAGATLPYTIGVELQRASVDSFSRPESLLDRRLFLLPASSHRSSTRNGFSNRHDVDEIAERVHLSMDRSLPSLRI